MCTSVSSAAGRGRSTIAFSNSASRYTDTPAMASPIARRKRRNANATTPTATIAQKLPNCMSTHTGGYKKSGRSLIARKTARSHDETSPPAARSAVTTKTTTPHSRRASSAAKSEPSAAADSG